jgi:type I restriction enzyme R subunit
VTGFTEASTIQAAITELLARTEIGWEYVPGKELVRDGVSPLIEDDVADALVRLNPAIAEMPERVNEILPRLRAAILAVTDDGLVAANERMTRWLRGLESHQFIGTNSAVPIRLIDFEEPRFNRLLISDEVVFTVGVESNRFDHVLFVNGFPLVVGEDKTPVNSNRSWLNAARDINQSYEPDTPGFFVSNVFSFATEGKDFRYGPIGLPAEKWLPWGKTGEDYPPYGLKRALRGAELLLTPEMVLEMLRSYTLYTTERIGRSARNLKVIARYPQVEGVEAVLARAKDGERKQGLLWQHQGSGKTFLAAFACGKLRRDVPGATVLVVLDRLDLIEQTAREFESAGVERITVAETRAELQQLLSEDRRGVIVTTIFRFKGAGLLNQRSDIVALVDEAHRTQEGTLGDDMRTALPNATYIGLTGTAISEHDRDTFESFGNPDDPDHVLVRYTPERSIEDGATVPLRVEAPRPDLRLDAQALDEAFDELAIEEGLSDEEKELVARRASHASTLFKADSRVNAVCADIVDHFHSRIAPLGMKAQVVAYDRELCVRYLEQIQRLFDECGEGDEATVVMTVSDKDDPRAWRAFDRDRAAEAKVKARFRDSEDPLKLLIVTAKLLTGFDAPIEGVMYLDRPLRKHTLFQALTRTNRRWTNPSTGQEKTHGLIVDYVGLGKEIANSMLTVRRGDGQGELEIEPLKAELKAALAACLERFDGVEVTDATFAGLSAAQERLESEDSRDAFAREFLPVQALFELLWPNPDLRDIRDSYRWLAKVYESVQPPMASDALLWHRVGAKTLALVNEHVVTVDVRGAGVESVTIDEDTLEALRELQLPVGEETAEEHSPCTEEILDRIEKRIERRLAEGEHVVYRSLAERLDDLRLTQLASATDSIEFLKRLLEVAKDLGAVDRKDRGHEAEEDGDEQSAPPEDTEGLPLEERIGALSQIFQEYRPDTAPDIVERVAKEIDEGVRRVRFTNWQTSHEGAREVRKAMRRALQKYELAHEHDLFDRAYAYVAEHY